MKVIFLSIGLLAVTSVAGQQKETIDLDELIRYRYDSSLHKMKWSSEFLQKQLNPAPNPIIQPESKDFKGQLDYQLPNGDLVFPFTNRPDALCKTRESAPVYHACTSV
jgi:hypothetical protein